MKYKFNLSKQQESLMLGAGGIILILVLWYLVTALNLINPVFLSTPGQTVFELFWFFKSGFIYEHAIVSLSEFLAGFTLALISGVLLGFVFGWNNKINSILKPLIYSLYATPIIAIFPLIILWFGIDFWPKVTIIFLAVFFPVLINTTDAVKNIDQSFIRLARSFMASDLKILKTIIFPNSIPNIISGIKIAIPRGIIGMVIAEFFTGSVGIGYLIAYYGATFQTARLLASVLLIIFTSIIINIFMDYLERRTQAWKL